MFILIMKNLKTLPWTKQDSINWTELLEVVTLNKTTGWEPGFLEEESRTYRL